MKKRAISFIQNESGMGILQMLILAAVGSALMAAIGASVVTMFKSQNTVAQSLDARLFNDQLSLILSNDQMCSDFLTGTMLPAPSKTEVPISRPINLASGTKNISVGSPIDENLEIAAASVRYDDPGLPLTVVQGTPPVSYKIAQTVLTVQLRKRGSNTFVKNLQPLEIRMFANLGPANNMIGCSAFSAGSLACVAGGGIWNPLSPDGMKCIPQKYCQYAGSFSDAPANAGGFVNPLTGANSCPDGFTKQISGLINKAAASGKYSVTNTPYRLYTCMSCGTPLFAQTAPDFTPGTEMPYTDMNDTAYEAVSTADDNNANLAEADTALAYKKWQDGLAKSALYQANINSANNAMSSAQAAVDNANTSLSNASAAVTTATNALAAANALSPANPGAVASAQSSLDSANSNYTYYSNQLNSAISTRDSTNATQSAVITTNSDLKKAQDKDNITLEASYWAAKAVSDQLRIIAKCSFTKWKAHQDPSLEPNSCEAIPACPVHPPSVTVVTPYGSC